MDETAGESYADNIYAIELERRRNERIVRGYEYDEKTEAIEKRLDGLEVEVLAVSEILQDLIINMKKWIEGKR
jgi:hypothetical protein